MPQSNFSPPWLLIIGLGAGIAFVGWVVYDSTAPSSHNANLVSFTEANWQQEVVDSNVPVFVDFTATWCGPCKKFAPTVDRLAERFKGKVKVGKFDVGDTSFSKGRTLQQRYDITGVPHVMIFPGGDKKPLEYPGGASYVELAKVLDSILASR